jgi:hypothetical protein
VIDDPTFTWALGFFAGATAGFWFGVRWRRPPYSSAAIAFRATAEDAAKVRSKIVNPLVWEDPPEQFIRMDEGPVQRGNGSGGPTTPKPPIVPKGQAVRTRRWFINNPVQIAECGGPCTVGPSHCDCGALWVDVPTPNPPPEVP